MYRRYIIAKRRSEQGKLMRKQYKNDIGVPYSITKGYQLILDGYSGAITTFSTDNNIFEFKSNTKMAEQVYHEHPTKEQLVEYFKGRIIIRKMTPREAFRLMDVDDADIDKIMNATAEGGKKKLISKTACYKLAGNSIVVSNLYHIFRTMFIPNQPEGRKAKQLEFYF